MKPKQADNQSTLPEDSRLLPKETLLPKYEKDRILQLEKELKVLQHSNKELEQLIYSVSHDFLAPLRHISSYAQMSIDLQDPIEKEHQYLQHIVRASGFLSRMVDELFQFAQSRNKELKKEWVDLEALVHSVQSFFSQDTHERDIQWTIEALPPIFADKLMMEKVFLNLLSNAVKYTSKSPEPKIWISSQKTKSSIELVVKDNGSGFNMKRVGKLFEVFQRLHDQEEFEGTGIGLASVHHIISRHGGKIQGEGKQGEGASFYITLPLEERE